LSFLAKFFFYFDFIRHWEIERRQSQRAGFPGSAEFVAVTQQRYLLPTQQQ
jgi:hypothetical protein